MQDRIIIIHRSKVVTRGMASFLQYHFPHEIIQINDASAFKGLFHLKRVRLLISSFIFKTEVQSLKEQLGVPLIGICPEGHDESPLVFDDHFRLEDDEQVILDLCKKHLSTKKASGIREGDHLSGREKDVLKCVAKGYSNKRIAEELYISVHTVISHRKRITQKTGIKSISGLTIYAILNKLIDPSAFVEE